MISDVLFEASCSITDYLRDMPDVYGAEGVRAQILAVQRAMDDLRIRLDTPIPISRPRRRKEQVQP